MGAFRVSIPRPAVLFEGLERGANKWIGTILAEIHRVFREIKALIRRMLDKRNSFLLLLLVTIVVLVTMAYFAFRLRGNRPGNNVQWSDPGPGLSFKQYSIVHGKGEFPPASYQPENGLTLELAIEPRFTGGSGFKSLLLIHSGQDDRQLMVGQWRSYLVVMNGNDYSYRRRRPRISFSMDESSGKTRMLTVVSGIKGTAIYVDGQLKKQDKTLLLKYPPGSDETILVIGNTIYGNQPWTGTVKGLALYDRALDKAHIKTHHRKWRKNRDFNAFKDDAPNLLYATDEGQGKTVHNRIGSGFDLALPKMMGNLKKNFLSWPRVENMASPIVIKDAIVNLLGFIPLGLFLMAIFAHLDRISKRMRWRLTLLIVFSFSMFIEIVQVWLPLRYSSSMDLMLNTLGGGLGIVIYNLARRYISSFGSNPA